MDFSCSMFFKQKPVTFATDQSKIHFMMGLLREWALAWAEAVYSNVSSGFNSYDDFVETFQSVLDQPYYLGNVSNRLLSLQQGSRSVADFWLLMRSGTSRLCAQNFLKGFQTILRMN